MIFLEIFDKDHWVPFGSWNALDNGIKVIHRDKPKVTKFRWIKVDPCDIYQIDNVSNWIEMDL